MKTKIKYKFIQGYIVTCIVFLMFAPILFYNKLEAQTETQQIKWRTIELKNEMSYPSDSVICVFYNEKENLFVIGFAFENKNAGNKFFVRSSESGKYYPINYFDSYYYLRDKFNDFIILSVKP